MKKQYSKPMIETCKAFDKPTLMNVSWRPVIQLYGIEGDIEEQEFNETEFTTTWGNYSDGSTGE